jgi:hypothetical protein
MILNATDDPLCPAMELKSDAVLESFASLIVFAGFVSWKSAQSLKLVSASKLRKVAKGEGRVFKKAHHEDCQRTSRQENKGQIGIVES